MTPEEIRVVLEKHQKWLNDQEGGEKANLSRADLSGANLARANLTWADLSKADLSRADLTEANLTEADLSRANLTWADLTCADLSRANLSRADLTEANLNLANLRQVVLCDANLDGVKISYRGTIVTVRFVTDTGGNTPAKPPDRLAECIIRRREIATERGKLDHEERNLQREIAALRILQAEKGDQR